jgi:transposase
MDVIVDRACGLDVHKRTVSACVRLPADNGGRRQLRRTFKTFSGDLSALADWLAAEGVAEVAMEATGVFWKPVWAALEGRVPTIKLVNARHVRMVPGRKTDVADAAWLAQLCEAGLLRGSFIPPAPIRRLRDLTRYRKRLIQDRTREVQRVDKVLEDASIKLGSVASKTMGRSGRLMIDALINGQRDPVVLADLAIGKLNDKNADLQRALVGEFDEHHARLARAHLRHIDELTIMICDLDADIATAVEPYANARDHLMTIPGVGRITAEVIIAEMGVDMSVFPTAGHLAKWAGMCPGNNESGGKQRSGRTSPASPWLVDVLIQAAWAATHTKNTYLNAQFWRLARRIGKKRAAVAVAHSITVSIWHILTNDVDYHDLGGDYFDQRYNTAHETRRLVRRLEALGHNVTITPAS